MATLVGDQLIREALELLAANGIAVERWVVLSDGHRSVVELQPCNWVARIAALEHEPALERELSLAGNIADLGGPIAHPIGPPNFFRGGSFALSLWERLTILGPASPGPAYRELRPFLDAYRGSLPDFRDSVRAARDSLRGPLPGLSAADAHFVAQRFDRSFDALAAATWRDSVLHGDPHAGNVRMTPSGVRWFDLESACRGPLEWDLSALPTDHGLVHDPRLLALLKQVRSACVVAWCASKVAPNREQREAVADHLCALRA